MKVILLEDIKNKGKKYDVKEFASGYANFLIRENQAIVANKENLNSLQVLKAKLNAEFEKAVADASEIVNEAKSLDLSISRPLSPKGTFIKTITKKEIVEMINQNLTKGQLDPKDVQVENIKSPGRYLVAISIPVGNGVKVNGKITFEFQGR